MNGPMRRLSERPVPLMLSVEKAHLAVVTIRRSSKDLGTIAGEDTIIVAALREIADELEAQITAGMAAWGLDKAEREAVFEEVIAFADALGERDA